mmetsp:Transcript_47380/g.74052  ORF Transcript_47380/g.74052 Transcript_47380/m.74052 type:complete len:103 (+) Transcript_47380:380-688(+)
MLKVDTQGHEPGVVMSGPKLFSEDPPDIVHAEFSPQLMKSAGFSGKVWLNWLYDYGYTCYDCAAFRPPPFEVSDINEYELKFGEFLFKGANHGQWADMVCTQ